MISDILNAISQSLLSCIGVPNTLSHGLAEYIEVNGGKYPFVKSESKKICINDGIPVQFYFVLLGHSETDDQWYGRKKLIIDNYRIRLVVILRDDILESNQYLSQIKGFVPRTIKLPEYNSINLKSFSVTYDHDTIIGREWKTIDYSKHRCKFSVFDITFTISASSCVSYCVDG